MQARKNLFLEFTLILGFMFLFNCSMKGAKEKGPLPEIPSKNPAVDQMISQIQKIATGLEGLSGVVAGEFFKSDSCSTEALKPMEEAIQEALRGCNDAISQMFVGLLCGKIMESLTKLMEQQGEGVRQFVSPETIVGSCVSMQIDEFIRLCNENNLTALAGVFNRVKETYASGSTGQQVGLERDPRVRKYKVNSYCNVFVVFAAGAVCTCLVQVFGNYFIWGS